MPHLHLAGLALLGADIYLEGATRGVAMHVGVGSAVIFGIPALFRWSNRHDRAATKAYMNGEAHHDKDNRPILCGGCGRASWDGNPVFFPSYRCGLCLAQSARRGVAA